MITLLLIVLISILLIGFLTTSRLEVAVSRSHLDGVTAGFYSDTGVRTALAKMDTAIGTTNVGVLWTTSPGRLNVSGTNIDLSSGTNASASSSDSVDLNSPGLEDSSRYTIAMPSFSTNSAPAMRVAWVYVDRDGAMGSSRSTNSIGRFAFWVDDESAKINLNTAWKRGNTNATNHPSQVNLKTMGFTDEDADKFQVGRPFNTIGDARRPPLPGAVVDGGAFQLSTYNHSPELNMFNQPRIVLTTQKSLASGSAEFLDILRTDNTDPGVLANLDPAKVSAQVNKIAALLNRTDWPIPGVAGKSFGQKYSLAGAHQIALNIIDYVRSAESPTALVEPIRGNVDNGSYTYSPDPFPDQSLTVSKGIAGNTRGLRITEFGIYVSPQPAGTPPPPSNKPYFLVKLKMEVYLPTGFGLSQVDLSQVRAGCVILHDFVNGSGVMSVANADLVAATPPGPRPLSTPFYLSGFGVESGSRIMSPGESRTLVASGYFSADTRSGVTIKSARLGVNNASGARNELVPTRNNGIPYVIDADTVLEPSMTTRSVDDPSANKNYDKDWSVQKLNTFSAANSSTLGTTATIMPKQDTDANNLVTDVGMRFPAPKGQAGNPLGMIQSVAELGFVHTGLQTLNLAQPSVPWRSLRLQPQHLLPQQNDLPDWAILDLFQAPRIAGESFYVRPPAANGAAYLNSGGKVNLNAEIQPFQDNLKRPLPLEAVFDQTSNGTATLTGVEAKGLVLNASQKVLGAGGSFYELDRFISPGQIAEIKGMADSGELSETLVRNTVDLLTSRTGVFSIYSVGQSIRQSPNGAIKALGERRDRVVVERTQSSTGETSFRTVYTESFNP